jgi:hypothetical protein
MDRPVPLLSDAVEEVRHAIVEGPPTGKGPEGLDEVLPLLDVEPRMSRGDLCRPPCEEPELGEGDRRVFSQEALSLDEGPQEGCIDSLEQLEIGGLGESRLEMINGNLDYT